MNNAAVVIKNEQQAKEVVREMKKAELTIEWEVKPVHEVFGLSSPFTGASLQTIQVAKNKLPFVPEWNPKFHFTKEMVRDLLINRELNMPLHLVGPKGCGKSESLEQLYARLGLPFIRVQGGPGVDSDFLFGRTDLEDGSTTWLDGLATLARRNGFAFCIDEIDGLRTNLGPELNAFAEIGKPQVLAGKGFKKGFRANDVIVPCHKMFRLYATSNTGGKAEKDAQFAGTNVINGALIDRFVYLICDYMDRDEEKKILMDAVDGLKEVACDAMLDFAEDFRKGYKMGECYDTISLRSLIQWGRMWVAYQEADKPFQMAVYGALNSHDRNFVEGLFEAKIGHTLALPKHMQPIMATAE